MAGQDWMRAADWDREQTVEVLRQAYAEGRLDSAELDERTDAALRAKTVGELRGLIADIPRRGPAPCLPADQPWRAAAARPPRRPATQLPRASVLLLVAAAVCVLMGAVLSNTALITVALAAGLGTAIMRQAGR